MGFDWDGCNFDIDILLVLQQFRNGIGGVFADFLAQMTWLAELKTVLVIMAVIYWGCSKRFGSFLLLGWSANRLINGFLKIAVCAYRPWIRDPRIVPYGHSIETATGYSFPSGHSTNAASVYGGGMLWKGFPAILRLLMAVIVILVPFSRLYLGVHTPQDVLCGTAFSLLTMWLVLKLMRWLENHPGKDWVVFGIGIILSTALAAYAGFKPYPADYDARGKLLVDGMKMARDTFKCVGWVSGFLVAWILERRLVSFSTDIPGVVKATRIAAGMVGYYILNLIFIPLFKNSLGPGAFAVAASFLQMFYIVFFFPLIFSVFEKWQKRRKENSNTVSGRN